MLVCLEHGPAFFNQWYLLSLHAYRSVYRDSMRALVATRMLLDSITVPSLIVIFQFLIHIPMIVPRAKDQVFEFIVHCLLHKADKYTQRRCATVGGVKKRGKALTAQKHAKHEQYVVSLRHRATPPCISRPAPVYSSKSSDNEPILNETNSE